MKHLFLLLTASFLFFVGANAQCPGKVKFTVSKMEILDESMTVIDTKEGKITFETTEKGFKGVHEGEEDDPLVGELKSVKCDWKQPYINGKTVMVADVRNNNETMTDATITIEAADGKMTIVLNAKEHADKIIRLLVDKYEEIK